jgi:hypothetical protein
MPTKTKAENAAKASGAEIAGVVKDAVAAAADIVGKVQEIIPQGVHEAQGKAGEISERVKHLNTDQAQETIASAAGSVKKRQIPVAVILAVVALGVVYKILRSKK